MISRVAVIKAVLVVLRAGGKPVGLNGAPDPAPRRYQVLEIPASQLHDEGDLDDSERHLLIRFSIRTVATANDREAAALAATEEADSARTRMRTQAITGTGWKAVSVETLSTSGIDNEGTLANLVDDFQLLAVPA